MDPPTYLPRIQPFETRNQFADDFSWVKGKHAIKAGFSFEHVSDIVNTITNRYGSYTYATVTCFAMDYTPIAVRAVRDQHHGPNRN